MRRIDLQFSALYAEFAQRCLDGRFAADLDPDGRFEATAVKGRRYWCSVTSVAGQRQRRYVGPAELHPVFDGSRYRRRSRANEPLSTRRRRGDSAGLPEPLRGTLDRLVDPGLPARAGRPEGG